MTRRTKTAVALSTAAVLLALTGCATDGGQRDGYVGGDPVYVFTRTVPDGRTIPCIGWSHGLQCDWTAAR